MLIPFLLAALFLSSCGTGKKLTVKGQDNSLQEEIVGYGKKFLGTNYRSGGKDPKGFDCSGYTSFIFQKFGYRLSKSSSGQAAQVPGIDNPEELKVGDLVFYEGRRQNGTVGHVGIVTEVKPNGQFRFIHSSTSNGVIISSSNEPYYKARYVKGGRVIEDGGRYYATKNQGKKKKAVSQTRNKNRMERPESIPANEAGEKGIALFNPMDNTLLAVNALPATTIAQEPSAPITQPASETADHEKKQKEKIKDAVKKAIVEPESETIPEPEISILAENDANAILYTVQMGDTLYAISRKYGCSVESLKSWNPKLKNMLKSGDTLTIYR